MGQPISTEKGTFYPKIKYFSFVSQDSIIITEKTFKNKIYIADFIYISCPSICPIMIREMKKVYEIFKNNPNIYFLSHTIYPENDTVAELKAYTKNQNINGKKWFFVTGQKDNIYSIAENSYFATAYAYLSSPGNYIHSGSFLLVDTQKHIRGVYNGTNHEDTDQLIADLNILLNEEYHK